MYVTIRSLEPIFKQLTAFASCFVLPIKEAKEMRLTLSNVTLPIHSVSHTGYIFSLKELFKEVAKKYKEAPHIRSTFTELSMNATESDVIDVEDSICEESPEMVMLN